MTPEILPALRQSDWLMCYVCSVGRLESCDNLETFFVVNQTLQSFSGMISPNTTYPFSRLAFANSTTASSMYIYHQFNETMLIEDTYEDSVDWTSVNITIPSG